MPTVTIEINAPEGTTIEVHPVNAESDIPAPNDQGAAAPGSEPEVNTKLVREYLLDFMPTDGPQPELYRVSAERMLSEGRFTVDDLADDMGAPASAVHAHVRNASRTVHTWRKRKGIGAPVGWIEVGKTPDTRRVQFAYRPGVAEAILEALGSQD